MNSANIVEIFSSIQGEGKYLGCRQIFIRLASCNLNCNYCDTDFSPLDFCRVETSPNSMVFYDIPNPMNAAQIIDIVKKFCKDIPIHSVSFTGGEPLLNWQFLNELAIPLKSLGLKIFLETNGTLPDALRKIIDSIDIISMDIKLLGGGKKLLDLHKKFLLFAREKELYVKIVVTGETTPEEFSSAVKLIVEVDRNILLIIQPVTPVNEVSAISTEKILFLQAAAQRELSDVRIIPQMHKFLNLL